ncbi:RNA-binding protein [Candidatus Bathyarchaeota archaeon B24-2]|nr:MAG: RNA-binding protein [Candidatus Bathyarchaeota archaeon B24-2]
MGGVETERYGALDLIVKTPLGLERIAASRIEELGVECHVHPKPHGFLGLVIVSGVPEDRKWELAERIKNEVPEVERVLVSEESVKADLDAIVESAVRVSSRFLDKDTSFAVRTVRRGKHPYTSIDVNCRVGSAIVEALESPVDLESPDKIVWIEIVGESAAVGVIDGKDVWRKMGPEKVDLRRFFSKVSVVQTPYFGPKNAIKTVSSRVGRAVQMFEVGEFVIATVGAVDAKQLELFIQGVLEGIESRYSVQKRIYAYKPRRVKVLVQDLYQLVRDRRGEPKVVFEPEGEPFPKAAGKLADILTSSEARVNLLFGSREGIPKGVFRFADLIVDLCPGITLSTEYAASSALIGLAFAVEEKATHT